MGSLGLIPVFSFWLLASNLWAQSSADHKRDEAAIQYAKRVLVSSLDRGLPSVTLEYFLKYESSGAAIHWEVNDCGEQTGDPATDRDRDLPLCVEADFDVEQRSVTVAVAIGTFQKWPSGAPSLFYATITIGGKVHSIRQLGGLPKELHRPLPKSPRE